MPVAVNSSCPLPKRCPFQLTPNKYSSCTTVREGAARDRTVLPTTLPRHTPAPKCAAPGIYFEHLSCNALVHHNIVLQCSLSPVQVNNPSYGMMVFNNSCWKTGVIKTFDHSRRNDLHLSRFFNNIFNAGFRLPKSATVSNNVVNGTPPYVDPKNGDFRLKKSLGKNIGAIPFGKTFPRVGCDFKNPP